MLKKTPGNAIGLPILLSILSSGCLSDSERCDEGQRLEEGRCLPALADGGDGSITADSSFADRGADDSSTAGPCAMVPSADQIAGIFKQTGSVDTSDCVAPMPTAGFAVDGEVALMNKGVGLVAKLEIVVSIEGGATIGADGAVTISADGSLLDITFSAEERLCFTDANSASGRATIKLANPAGPLCSFGLPVKLERK